MAEPAASARRSEKRRPGVVIGTSPLHATVTERDIAGAPYGFENQRSRTAARQDTFNFDLYRYLEHMEQQCEIMDLDVRQERARNVLLEVIREETSRLGSTLQPPAHSRVQTPVSTPEDTLFAAFFGRIDLLLGLQIQHMMDHTAARAAWRIDDIRAAIELLHEFTTPAAK